MNRVETRELVYAPDDVRNAIADTVLNAIYDVWYELDSEVGNLMTRRVRQRDE